MGALALASAIARGPIALSLLIAFIYMPNREWTPLSKGLPEVGSLAGVPSNSCSEVAGGAGTGTTGWTVGETGVAVVALEIDGGDRSFHYLCASAGIARDATGSPLRPMPRFPSPVWRRRFAKPLHPLAYGGYRSVDDPMALRAVSATKPSCCRRHAKREDRGSEISPYLPSQRRSPKPIAPAAT